LGDIVFDNIDQSQCHKPCKRKRKNCSWSMLQMYI